MVRLTRLLAVIDALPTVRACWCRVSPSPGGNGRNQHRMFIPKREPYLLGLALGWMHLVWDCVSVLYIQACLPCVSY